MTPTKENADAHQPLNQCSPLFTSNAHRQEAFLKLKGLYIEETNYPIFFNSLKWKVTNYKNIEFEMRPI